MEWCYHCQSKESAAQMLEMPFVIVHSDLAVASLRLHKAGSHVKCA